MKGSPVSGLRAWIIQRFTAVYLLVFFLLLLGYFAFFPPGSYDGWHEAISSTVVFVAFAVFVVALLAHAWIGLRDVILDYVKPLSLRVAALALLALYLTGMGAWVARVLFRAVG